MRRLNRRPKRSKAAQLVLDSRLKLNISQGKLCRHLGYTTPQYLSNFERGLCYFPIPKLKKCCEFLDIPEMMMIIAMRSDFETTLLKEWRP